MTSSEVLKVTTFGGFSISAGDSPEPDGNTRTVSDSYGHSKKLWGLMEYLIMYRNRPLSVDELYELLWSGETSDDPMNALKILVHRARNELNKLGGQSGKELILHRHGGYQWNADIPLEVDAERFDILYARSRQAEGDQKLQCLLDAVALYKGHFLPKSISYQWVIPLDTYFHSKYIEMCIEAAAMLKEREQHAKIVEILRVAVAVDPFVEELHIALIHALYDSGTHSAALEHYKSITEKFYKQFGMTPSEELLGVYRSLSKTVSEYESDVTAIRDGLAEKEDPEGAYHCELEVFREISHLKARESQRSGQVIHLALINVVHAPGRRISQKAQTKIMDRLFDVVLKSLRVGDVFARYSLRQYILLLPSASYENGEMVLERISRNFRNIYPKSGALLQCSLMPLEPQRAGAQANEWLKRAGSSEQSRQHVAARSREH